MTLRDAITLWLGHVVVSVGLVGVVIVAAVACDWWYGYRKGRMPK
jgi:hypothetical protein